MSTSKAESDALICLQPSHRCKPASTFCLSSNSHTAAWSVYRISHSAMEGVASGMAVASLSLQLVDSIIKIKNFLRHVKDAPKELERLIDLLERLEALLEDVRSLIERQTSLHAQHFPLPSNTINHCLRSCEKTLQPLHELVKSCSTPAAQESSGLARLKRDIKLGLKAKDIVGFETRVEHETGYLQAALGTNTTSILITTLPTLMQNRKVTPASRSMPLVHTSAASAVTPVSIDSSLTHTRSSRCVRKLQRVPALLGRLGLNRCNVTRYYRPEPRDISAFRNREELIFEKEEFSLVWTRVGYRISWHRGNLWGDILPSLSVCPVVQDFSWDLRSSIWNGDVQGLQQLLISGKVHPHARDQYGDSLLHLAAEQHQASICRLLLQHGVKPDPNSHGYSVFAAAVDRLNINCHSDRTDTFRALMSSREAIENMSEEFTRYVYWFRHSSGFSPEPFEWLWTQLMSMEVDEDLVLLRCRVFYCALFGFVFTLSRNKQARAPKFDVSPRTRHEIENVSHIEFRRIFRWAKFAEDTILEVLVEHGINVEACLTETLAWYNTSPDSTKGLILKRDREQGWTIDVVWKFDPQASGYLVVNEFPMLTDQDWVDRWEWQVNWSFSGGWVDISPNADSRFKRKMASKARKERARTGQKQARSKMPGAWT
ncbi:hypothetical protein J1614_006203 [Plenodomus biglobosus]|nr:hypothetical protein J1614_006203 [Plenodomus biglobosus]